MKEVLPVITAEEINMMTKILEAGHIEHKYAVRLQTVLNRAAGKSTNDIATFLGINIITVSRYVKRFNSGGLEAMLKDKTRKPGKQPIDEKTKEELCRIVCHERPEGETHWSTRALARKLKISHQAVNKILRERGLKPHLTKHFQYSNDPEFESKLKDVVGLYLNPPDNAIVLCIDEKSQIQALERTQPLLPMRSGIPERQTHDYKRNGTTTLFAALNVLTGNVIGKCEPKHTNKEYIQFLRQIDKSYSAGKTLHIISDNYATHKTKDVKDYIASTNGRFVEHFIPTHSSWLNLVERFFAEITNKAIRRGSWESVTQLEHAIREYIKTWNKSGRKFQWVKTADKILNNILRSQIYAI